MTINVVEVNPLTYTLRGRIKILNQWAIILRGSVNAGDVFLNLSSIPVPEQITITTQARLIK